MLLVEKYEEEHFAIPASDPVEATGGAYGE